jgi:hypothetical protein
VAGFVEVNRSCGLIPIDADGYIHEVDERADVADFVCFQTFFGQADIADSVADNRDPAGQRLQDADIQKTVDRRWRAKGFVIGKAERVLR